MLGTMTRAGLAMVLGTMALAGLPAPAQSAPAVTTAVTMVSESGDYIGGGASRAWIPAADASAVTVSGSLSGLTVTASGGASGDEFRFSIAPPAGEDLAVGTYERAERTPFRSAGHPGISVTGEGRGCNTNTGRFTVRDIAPDLSSFWIVYEQHCEGGESAVFGEIRYQQPGGDPDLIVAPGAVAWPDEYPGVSGRVVPVTLANTGADPLTFSDSEISGDDDFSVVGSDCATLAPGGRCTVYVAFRPTAKGPRVATLTVHDDSPAGAHAVELSGRGIAGRTSWTMHSEKGDYIGGGRDYSYNPGNATITASGTESYVQFNGRWGGDYWSARFEPDAGRLLLPGTVFRNVTRYPFNDASVPGMDVSGAGRGCNELTGKFIVDHAVYDAGELREIAIRFEQHCEGMTPALYGTLEWRVDSESVPPPGDHEPPAPVTNVQVYPMVGSAVLGWDDPLATDYALTVVRGARGLVPPETVGDGEPVYVGRDGGVLVDGLVPGGDYSYTIFPRDEEGNFGDGTSVTLRGTDLSIATPTITYGLTSAKVTGYLVDGSTGDPLVNVPVLVYGRAAGARGWELVGSDATGPNGGYLFEQELRGTTDYQVRYAGAGRRLGVTAGPSTLRVAPRLSLHSDRSRAVVGEEFHLGTHVWPSQPGDTVVLQRRARRGWETLERLVLGDRSTAEWTLVARRTGDTDLRVLKQADPPLVRGVSRVLTLRTVG